MADGDLWKIYVRLLRQKGEHAVRVSKVKAHTSVEDIAKGIISEADRIGNDHSDTLADRGATRGDSPLLALAHIFPPTKTICQVYDCHQ